MILLPNHMISISEEKDVILLDEPFQAMDSAQEELARGKISLAAHNGKTFLITIPKIYE